MGTNLFRNILKAHLATQGPSGYVGSTEAQHQLESKGSKGT